MDASGCYWFDSCASWRSDSRVEVKTIYLQKRKLKHCVMNNVELECKIRTKESLLQKRFELLFANSWYRDGKVDC